MAKVSVLLTSYNHVAYLPQSIDSILSQTFQDFELYITDDGSVDGSQDVIRGYDDPRIHAILFQTNGEVSNWAKTVKPQMTGEYLAIAHCDDKWMPDKLEKQVAYLDAHPECAACFTDVQVIDEDGAPYGEEEGFYYNLFTQKNRSRFEWLHHFFYEGNCLCHPSLLIRMNSYDEYGLTNTTSLSSLPDFNKWVKLTLHADLYVYPEKLACFRIRKNAGNASGDKPEGHIRSAFEMIKVLENYLELKDRPEDFLKVFPSAQQYVRNGHLLVEYAYARILLDESTQPAYNLLGLMILQRLVGDPVKSEILKRDYGYMRPQLARESGAKDVFKVIGEERFQQGTLFWRDADAYNEQACLTKTVYVAQNGHFSVTYTLPEHTQITALRFDPDEGHFRRYSDLKVLVDEEEFPAVPLYAFERTEGSIAFYTTAPQFEIALPQRRKVRTVEISGQTSRLLPFEVEEKAIWKAAQEKRVLEQDLREVNEKVATLESDLDEVFANLEAARREQAQEHQAYVALQDQLAQRDARLQAYAEDLRARSEYLQHHRLKAAVRALLGRPWNQ